MTATAPARNLLLSFALVCCTATAPAVAGGPEERGAPTAGPRAEADRALVVGRVTNNPRKDWPEFKRFADYLAAHLEDLGVTGSRIQFAEDDAMMVDLLRDGAVDLVPESVFPALLYAEKAGADLILREWRNGRPTYRSLLFARGDSVIEELGDLAGKTIAFEDPGSTSAYFVPRAELESAGLRVVKLSEPGEAPPPDAVGYVFAGSENNIVLWVHQGLVDAGAFNDADWDDPTDAPPELKKDLGIFHRSEPLPRTVGVVRGDLRPEIRDRIKEVLLAAHEDPEGRAVLKAYKDVARYDELIGGAAAGVEEARRMIDAARPCGRGTGERRPAMRLRLHHRYFLTILALITAAVSIAKANAA